MTPTATAKLSEAAVTTFVALIARWQATSGNYVVAVLLGACALLGAWLVLRRTT